ncbi:MAG: hypothetical protein P8P30_05645 [Rickettsiales bacterium]|nr:hypothetical protein [Rickettsiales bacterium]
MAESNQFQPIVTSNLTATIADTATESDAIDLSGTTLSAIAFPAEFDGTAVTLKAASSADSTFVDVHDMAGTQMSITASASRMTVIEPAKLAGVRFIKLVADTAQDGATILTLMTRPV